jgi:hypothetical protein
MGAQLDCDIEFAHISGVDNKVADLLSRWDSCNNPMASLFYGLNAIPVWKFPGENVFELCGQSAEKAQNGIQALHY